MQSFKAFQVVEQRARIAVISRNRLGVFVGIAFVGAGLIVGQHRSCWLQLVIHLRNSDDVAVAGDKGGKATDRAGGLEDLGKEHDGGILALSRGAKHIGPHGAGRCGEIDEYFFFKDHGRSPRISCTLRWIGPRVRLSLRKAA